MRFWLGGYTADMEGRARGIGTMLAGSADGSSAGGSLAFAGDAATAASPSWLARHPTLDVVYATLEAEGTVAAFRRTGEDSFVPLGQPVAAGAAVCHAAVAPDGGSLIASCWADGRVVRIVLDAAGRPSSPQIAVAARDPHGGPLDPFALTDEVAGEALASLTAAGSALDDELAAAARSLRAAVGDEFAQFVPGYDEVQAPPAGAAGVFSSPAGDTGDAPADGAASVPARESRAHSAVFLPDGRIATTDLGFDLVRIWRPTTAGLKLDHEVVLPFGTGPRHMVLHPSGHLHVLTEYSCEVFTLDRGREGRWHLRGGVAATSTPGIGDTAAEITRSHDGEFLSAGLRGSNTIATLRVRGAGERLEQVALVDAGVDWPRHHTVVRDILLVAGQRSDDIVSLTLDLRTGVPGRVRHRAEAPTPTCIVPARD
ncbi:lactonase family protein [Microbacterium sp. P01]|uniref:lactonase family protein n=1 Tax=unclassified Microbacterium TaxID=2609290 RepID=UPI00367001BD